MQDFVDLWVRYLLLLLWLMLLRYRILILLLLPDRLPTYQMVLPSKPPV
jgi:hypothetical protein